MSKKLNFFNFIEKEIQSNIGFGYERGQRDPDWWIKTELRVSKRKIKTLLCAPGKEIKICHLSDLHNLDWGRRGDFLGLLVSERPDLIFITGDGGDNQSRHQTYDQAYGFFLNLVARLRKIAPVFYVSGNHDFYNPDYLPRLEISLSNLGIFFLRNKSENFTINGQNLTIMGLDDPYEGNLESRVISDIARLSHLAAYQGFELNLLLAHRPEYIPIYDFWNCAESLVTFCGHAHGGGFNLGPWALIAPGQGLFPKYHSGLLRSRDRGRKNQSYFHISRGLYPSGVPFGVKPEVCFMTITYGEDDGNKTDLNWGADLFKDQLFKDLKK